MRIETSNTARRQKMTSHSYSLTKMVRAMKAQIIEDVRTGMVPHSVQGFGDLHNYVDANEYYGVHTPDEVQAPKRFADCVVCCNAAADIIDAWIKSGGIATEMDTPTIHP